MSRASKSRPLVLVALLLFGGACSDGGPEPTAPTVLAGVVTERPEPAQEMGAVLAAQARFTRELLRRPGIVGTAVGLDGAGVPVLLILIEHGAVDVPRRLAGVGVLPLVTGAIRASTPANVGNANRASTSGAVRFSRPVPIGVSTGHPDINAGTIGARVRDALGNVYALSNNHVYANANLASHGDPVTQPSAFDGGTVPADVIGSLHDFQAIAFDGSPNRIDAAIALTSPSMLGNATVSGGYGTPRSQTAVAAPNMQVQKCGRTTGCTRGRVRAINATVHVGYDLGVALFEGQIVIEGAGFSTGGDAGAVVVAASRGRNPAGGPRPVGLLFAAGSNISFANPIDLVLTRFGVIIDGN